MRQAIVTRYAGPTDTRDSRVIVKAQARRLVVPWDHALNPDENHAAAALAFARKWGWLREREELHGGALPDGSGYAFVFTTDGSRVEGSDA